MRLASFADPLEVAKYEPGYAHIRVHFDDTEEGVELKSVRYPGSKSLLVTQLFKPRTKYMVMESKLYGLMAFDHDFLYKSKDSWPYAEKAYLLTDVVANIYFHDDIDESIIVSNYRPLSNLGFSDRIPGPVRIHDWIAAQYPEGEVAPAHNVNLRFQLLQDVNTIDSIVALEQQSDLMLLLIKALLSNSEPPAWADDFVARLDDISVFKARPVEDVFSDLEAHKSMVRAKQKIYLEKKV